MEEKSTARPRGTDSAKVIQVIVTEALEGAGTADDPCRTQVRYWDFDGNLIDTRNPACRTVVRGGVGTGCTEEFENMNLYLISQDVNSGSDTYDSCIVCAENEDAAKKILPSEYASFEDGTWAPGPEFVRCKFIGKAIPGTPKGAILASFNAG